MNNNTPAQEMTGKQRCDTLAEISGLVVTSRVEKGQRIFTFALPYDSQCHVALRFSMPCQGNLHLSQSKTVCRRRETRKGIGGRRTMTMKTIPRWLAKYWVWYKRLGLPVLHSNQRVWYKYPWPKRLTLPHNPRIHRWLWWVW